MAITAAQVKELREKTGVGMMKCKSALNETDGNVEKAIELLRKSGAAVAAKRAGNDANEGVVAFGESDSKVSMAELRCETDFVANGDDFRGYAKFVCQTLLDQDINTAEELMNAEVDGTKVLLTQETLVAKITENIQVKNVKTFAKGEGKAFATYQHLGGKIGVAVELGFKGESSEAITALAKDLAMQVAAYNPKAITPDEIDSALIEKEREIGRELAIKSGTKPEFIDRQVDGKIKKWMKEVALEEQMFLKESKTPVKTYVANVGKEAGVEGLKIVSFARLELGA
jgi:elongation factor Ts